MASRRIVSLSILTTCLIVVSSNATEIPAGYVSGDWYSSGNPYNINGEITIHADSTLNIHEGVDVIFQGHYKFIVNGFLEAIGTESDSILFTAPDTSRGWHSLRFLNAPDSSHLSYCIVQHGKATGTGAEDPDAWGGGILCYTSSPVITHSTISNNWAQWYGGGIECNYSSNPSISHCVVSENSAAVAVGGIDCWGGSNATIESCTISGNWAGDMCGGIMCDESSPIIQNCTISGNTAASEGGGIVCVYNSNPTISTCDISNNSTTYEGGGILCDENANPIISTSLISGNTSVGQGGGMFYWHGSDATISNCTVSGNSSATGGSGIYINNSSPTIVNTIVEGNTDGTAGIHFSGGSTASFTYGDIYNNSPANIYGDGPAGLGLPAGVNANGDPCDIYSNIFLDPLFYAISGDSAFYLTAESPCIDAGDPTSPLDPDGTVADIGACYFDQLVGIEESNKTKIPGEFRLFPAYPNPFNPTTVIGYQLPVASWVRMDVFDVFGRLIESPLQNGWRKAGYHEVTFDGSGLTSGMYFYCIDAGDFTSTQKLLLLK